MRLDLRMTACMLPVLAILLGLGFWQLERLAWKEELIATRQAGYALDPVPVHRVPGETWRRYEYRLVSFKGRYLHDHEILLVSRRHRGKTGFGLLTPMELEDGRELLVDRGWIPGPEYAIERPQGVISLTGILRSGGRPNRWVPDNDPVDGTWFFIDVDAMAEATGLQSPYPFVARIAQEHSSGSGYPVALPGLPVLPNRHLEYALTWFGLAGVLVVIFVVYHGSRRRQETG